MLVSALALLLAAAPPWADGRSRPEDLHITLVIFGPGPTLTEWWGHSALVVEDTRLHEERIYNYGMFGFERGFVNQFVMGRLWFWVEEDDQPERLYEFYARYLDRDVRLLRLNLTPSQADAVAKRLAWNVLPENRGYLYQHYTDNCATRPRDVLDAALGGALLAATSGPARMTLREHTLRYSHVHPPMSLLLDFLQNGSLDGPLTQAGEAFLPDELERQVLRLSVRGPDGVPHPLVKERLVLHTSKRPPPPEFPPDWRVYFVAIGLGLITTLWVLSMPVLLRGRRRFLLGMYVLSVSVLCGVLGSVLFFLATVTDHLVAHRDENLLLANPLYLLLIPAAWRVLRHGGNIALAKLSVAWVPIMLTTFFELAWKVSGMSTQNNWNIILIIGPFNLLGGLIIARSSRK